MPLVDENRLKGNYGAFYVSALLSSQCLVRPVAAETDIGIDLYCETIKDGNPFLHFWVQVKTGLQCRIARDQKTASCSFRIEHLNYWIEQPVPIFAALVPGVNEKSPIYIIDVTSQLLNGIETNKRSLILHSDLIWEEGNYNSVADFINSVVPLTTARMQCRKGVIAHIPDLSPTYEITFPEVPVHIYKSNISEQIRRTAALSIIILHNSNMINGGNTKFRHLMADIVEQFGDDLHWENFMARALSQHADKNFNEATRLYQQAINVIEGDNLIKQEEWKQRKKMIRSLLKQAHDEVPFKK